MSDENDLQELKNTYSFNENLLKNCFIDEGQNIFQKYQLLSKIYNILIFRKKYEAKFKFPQLLFTFNNNVEEASTINKSIIGYFCSISKLNESQKIYITSKINLLASSITSPNIQNNSNDSNSNPHFDISDLLITIFIKTQLNTNGNDESSLNLKTEYNWIIDYFVYSTFPSLFGHFCSIEYLREGLSFISLLINDKIAPRLVGTFLNHSFLFKDRILSQFYCLLSKIVSSFLSNNSDTDIFNENNIDNINLDIFSYDSIESMFFEAFSSCISYFSIFHFRAVDLLRKVRGDDAAIEAIWEYFLLDEFVGNWEYSPIFSSLKSFSNRSSYNNQNQADENENIDERFLPKHRNILRESLNQISKEKSRKIQMKYVNLFSINSSLNGNDSNNDIISFNMPKISDLIFSKGIVFAITKLDLNLGHILRTFLKQISTISDGVTYESITSAIINYPGMKIVSLNEAQHVFNSVNILLRLTHIFPNQEIFPSPPDPNKSTIFDQLMYNKDVHNILYKRSGGLITAKTILGSIEKSILLESSSYANELFQIAQKNKNDQSNFNAAFYGETQRRLFVLQIVEMIINSIQCFSQFIHSVLGSEFPNALKGDVSNILKVKLSEEWANVKEKNLTKVNNPNDEQIKSSSYSLSSSESSVSDFSSVSLDIVCRSLIKTAEKIINSWKFIYNGNIEMEQNNQQKLIDSDLKIELYQPITAIFVFVTNEITKSLVYLTLSYVPHPIIPKIQIKQSEKDSISLINKERENALHSIVNSKSLRVPFLDSNLSLSFCLADPYISFYIDVTHDVQCFLLLLEKSFQKEFYTIFKSNTNIDNDDQNIEFCEQFNIGWKLQTFIQLEDMLSPILNNPKLNQNTVKMFITALFNGNDPFYFRLNLINVSRVVKSLCTPSEDTVRRFSNPLPPPKNASHILINHEKNISIQKVEDEKFVGKINSWLIYDILGQEVVDKFKNLQKWFSLIESS